MCLSILLLETIVDVQVFKVLFGCENTVESGCQAPASYAYGEKNSKLGASYPGALAKSDVTDAKYTCVHG